MMRFIENQQYFFKAQGYSVGTSEDIYIDLLEGVENLGLVGGLWQ